MNVKKLTAIIMLSASLFSCKKESTAPPVTPVTTSLKIMVSSISGSPVNDAQVQLFQTFADWERQSPVITTKLTGSDGIVMFTNLSSMKYYYFVSKGCLNNGFNNVSTAGNITVDVVNDASTTIDQAGSIVFNNVSVNPYRVYVNGVANFDLPGNTSKTLNYKPAGSYTIRVLQLSGYILNPTDQTYTGTVNCGAALTATFPQ